MPKPVLVLVLVVMGPIFVQAQTQNFWQLLAEVGFQSKTDVNGYLVETPVFSKNLRSWQGKKVRLKGYVIPANEVGDQDRFMLSSLPYNICYFCGAAGPETVVEVEPFDAPGFSTRAILIEGILILNDQDPGRHMYIIRSAQVVTSHAADMKGGTSVTSQ